MRQTISDAPYKQQLIRSFNKAANHYDSIAILQRETADRMMQRLQWVKIKPQIILDLGCATGYCSELLQHYYPDAKVISIDLAYQMLISQSAQKRCQNKICADALQLPLADHSVDMIFSNMMLPWCSQLDQLFSELSRVSCKEGLLMFTTVGPDSLREMRECWTAIDRYSHINNFVDMHDIGDALIKTQFLDPVMDTENLELKFPRVELILQDLKQMGSVNLSENKRQGLMIKKSIDEFIKNYQSFRDKDGYYPVTCEVIYGHAWNSGLTSASTVDQSGDISISLAHLRRRLRNV